MWDDDNRSSQSNNPSYSRYYPDLNNSNIEDMQSDYVETPAMSVGQVKKSVVRLSKSKRDLKNVSKTRNVKNLLQTISQLL